MADHCTFKNFDKLSDIGTFHLGLTGSTSVVGSRMSQVYRWELAIIEIDVVPVSQTPAVTDGSF